MVVSSLSGVFTVAVAVASTTLAVSFPDFTLPPDTVVCFLSRFMKDIANANMLSTLTPSITMSWVQATHNGVQTTRSLASIP